MADRLDSNGLLYVVQKIKALFVQKETGKGLSSNDYTTAEKNKLGAIASGAEVNTVEGVQRNGTDLTPDSSTRKVNVVVPVLGVQVNGVDLTPDSTTKYVNVSVPVVDSAISSGGTNPVEGGAIYTALAAKAPLASPAFTGNPTAKTQTAGNNSTRLATTAFVKTAIDNALGGITGVTFCFDYQSVAELPATGTAGYIYFIPATETETGNLYDEYVWTGTAYEKIGSAGVDLTGYFNETNLPAITNASIDTIIAQAMS